MSTQKRDKGANTVIACVKFTLVWRRVQIGERWALHTQSRCPHLISWTVILLSVVSLAQAFPTCISFPRSFAGAWLNIQALGCFSNYSLHISLINACEYWWGEPWASATMPAHFIWAQRSGGRVSGLRRRQVWVIYAVSHHGHNVLVIDVQQNWGHTLRLVYFPFMISLLTFAYHQCLLCSQQCFNCTTRFKSNA